MRKYFIINPVSGRGRTTDMIPELTKYKEAEIYVTSKKGDAERFIKERSRDGECVFYTVGGDGTLNEAVNAAAGMENVSIGAIPLGTGNDFVRCFSNREAFLDMGSQLRGRAIKVDTVKAVLDKGETVRFINMANIGFDCNVVISASKIKNGFISGPAAYALGALKEIFSKWGQDVKIRFDDGDTYKGRQLLCTIANGRYCGGGFMSSPYADVSDGYMDMAVIDKISRPKLISLLKKYRDGTYLEDPRADGFITYKRASEIHIKFRKETSISIDGEIFSSKSAVFTAEKQNINFIVPDGAYISGGRK